jgi:AcrR family transcriptional regulator
VATERFAAAGFHRTSLAEVAAAVEVTPPALYRHFRSREDLFLATVEGAGQLVERELTAAGSLAGLVDAAIRLTIEHRAEATLFAVEAGYVPARLRAPIAARERRILARWTEALRARRRGLADIEAELLVRAAAGVLLGCLTTVPDATAHDSAELWRRMMTATLLAGRPRTPLRPAGRARPEVAALTRREDVLRAAARLFRTAGYEAVGMDEIGAAAGTSGPAVYRYYPSKQDLLVTAFRRTGHHIAAEVGQAVAAAPTPRAALRALLGAYAGIAAGQGDLVAVYLREARSLPPDTRREMAAIQDDLVDSLARLVRSPALPGRQARVAALSVIGTTNAALPVRRRTGATGWAAWATHAANTAAVAAGGLG